MVALLAFDTATERLHVALGVGARLWTRDAAGGARSSATLLPAAFELLAEAGISLADLDAIAFGQGPGAFTGLRTACAVAQGLAVGTGKPLLALDTLMAVAEDAHREAGAARVWAVNDARMDEVYAGHYEHAGGRWQVRDAPALYSLEALHARWRDAPPSAIAGNAVAAFGARLQAGTASRLGDAAPRGAALLALARAAFDAGEMLDAADALPVYLRDKVALTTAERAALKDAPRAECRTAPGRPAIAVVDRPTNPSDERFP